MNKELSNNNNTKSGKSCANSSKKGSNGHRSRRNNANGGSSNAKNMDKMDKSNPLELYAQYPEILDVSARLAFPNRPGMVIRKAFDGKFTDSTGAEYNTKHDYNQIEIPGIIAIDWVPFLPKSTSVSDPASLTAKQLYDAVRSNFSNSLGVDAPDLFIQVMALAQIYAYISNLKRIYKSLSVTDPNNLMLPYGLLAAYGFSTEQSKALMDSRLDLLNYINLLIHMADKFIVPDAFPLITRQMWLNDRVYLDAPSKQAQMYVFAQQGYFSFKLLNTPDKVLAGGLEFLKWNPSTMASEGRTLTKQLYDFGMKMIDALSAWEEAYNINGYFTKTYGESKITLPLLGMDETVEFVYDEIVNVQIMNSSALPVPASVQNGTVNYDYLPTITQDPKTNAVLVDPQFFVYWPTNTKGNLSTAGIPINIPEHLVSTGMVVEATRLTSYCDEKDRIISDTGINIINLQAGTECVVNYRLLMMGTGPDITPTVFFNTVVVPDAALTDSDRTAITGAVALSWFDWAPLITVGICHKGVSGQNRIYSYLYGDIMNFTIMDQNQFTNINRVCLLSELSSFKK